MNTQPVGTSSSALPGQDVRRAAGHAVPEQSHAETATPMAQRVEAAISNANRAMRAISATVQFEVDPETKITVIKVVDTASNTVLRQMPAQEMLELAQALGRMQGVLLRQRA